MFSITSARLRRFGVVSGIKELKMFFKKKCALN